MESKEFVKKYDYNEVFLFDLSWHLHRSFHVFGDDRFSTVIDGQKVPTGHIFGLLRAIITVRERYPDSLIVLCKDGFPVRRHELMGNEVIRNEDGTFSLTEKASYKADRVKPSFNIYKDIEVLEKMLALLPNTVFAYHPEQESDDLMYTLARYYGSKGSLVFIYSGDDDLLQTISSKVCVVRHIDAKTKEFQIMDETYVINSNKFGVTPPQLPVYRAIVGDTSDKINGVFPRFPRDIARCISSLAQTYEDVVELLNNKPEEIYNLNKESLKTTKSTFIKYVDILRENLPIFKRNYEMMKLSPVEMDIYKLKSTEESLNLINVYKMSLYKKHLYEIKVLK